MIVNCWSGQNVMLQSLLDCMGECTGSYRYYVLKKDYIDLEPGQQIYEIPANREINELLWFTPSELNNLLFDPWAFKPRQYRGGEARLPGDGAAAVARRRVPR